MATTCEDIECNYTENHETDNLNVITLTPLKTTYNQGDELILKISLPATNIYFGKEINLYKSTGDNSALIILLSDNIFQNNILTFIKGSQGTYPNWFNLPYNSETEMYELEVKTMLNRKGMYSHYNGGEIEFGTSSCPDYKLNTGFIGIEAYSPIEFSVI